MESDGRIRSKDIETGGVNSRILNDIRSDDYNGSRTNPEDDPGTEGWQILKGGVAVFNQAVIRGTLIAARIISAVLESGSLNIRSGGSLTVGGDEVLGTSPLTTLDETKLRYNRVDGSRQLEITPAGGLKIYAANGTTELVVLDSDGLEIGGGMARALDISTVAAANNSAGSLTTTAAVMNTVVIDVPTWVLNARLIAIGEAQLSTGGTARHLWQAINVNDASAPSGFRIQHVAASTTGSQSNRVMTLVASPGSTITIRQWLKIDAGTEASHNEDLHVLAWFTR